MALPKKIPTMMNVDFSPKPVNTVWMDVAKEYCNTYLQSGMNAGSGTTTLPGISATLAGELMDATAAVTPVGMLTAVRMAKAFKNAVIAGRDSYLAGRMKKNYFASPSSPTRGSI